MASTTERTDHAQSTPPPPSTLEGRGKAEEEDEREHFDGLEEEIEKEQGSSLEDGELYLIPNDFNVATIGYFIEKDIIKAPFYQRHYVWDIKKASLFIESILFGLPIPTIFLQDATEGGKKRYDIIDGQQRLLTIYFFMNNVFPRTENARNLLRGGGEIKNVIKDKSVFPDFKLILPNLHSDPIQSKKGHRRYHDYTYERLSEIEDKPAQENFELTTIPITTIKISGAKNHADKSYEIYRRLNTTGVKLTPQQVRVAVYNSDFYKMLHNLNKDPSWRNIINKKDASKTMADLETLLRAAAFLVHWGDYRSSMQNFLNDFSYEMTKPDKKESAELLKRIFLKFFELSKNLSFVREVEGATGRVMRKFSIPAFEAIFVAVCEEAWSSKSVEKIKKISPNALKSYLKSKELTQLLSMATGDKYNIEKRYLLAKKLLT